MKVTMQNDASMLVADRPLGSSPVPSPAGLIAVEKFRLRDFSNLIEELPVVSSAAPLGRFV
jgi:hypothetical protein